MMVSELGTAGLSVVLVNVCARADERTDARGGKKRRADQVPAGVLDGLELVLVDKRPYKVGDVDAGVELEVELNVVGGVVLEVVDVAVGELIGQLEDVVAGPEGEDGVEDRDGATAGGESEKVRVAIGGEARVCGAGELLGLERGVSVDPGGSQGVG